VITTDFAIEHWILMKDLIYSINETLPNFLTAFIDW